MAAFQAAAAAGAGIELDVQRSLEGAPVVFHDARMERLTDQTGFVWDHGVDDLDGFGINGTHETIKRLSTVLSNLPAQTPVLIELKPAPGDKADYVRSVAKASHVSRCKIAVMSFDHGLCKLAREMMPGTAIGALLPASALMDEKAWAARVASAREVAPDYIAHHVSDCEQVAELFDLPRAAWTVTTRSQLSSAREWGAAPIFEQLAAAEVLDV